MWGGGGGGDFKYMLCNIIIFSLVHSTLKLYPGLYSSDLEMFFNFPPPPPPPPPPIQLYRYIYHIFIRKSISFFVSVCHFSCFISLKVRFHLGILLLPDSEEENMSRSFNCADLSCIWNSLSLTPVDSSLCAFELLTVVCRN